MGSLSVSASSSSSCLSLSMSERVLQCRSTVIRRSVGDLYSTFTFLIKPLESGNVCITRPKLKEPIFVCLSKRRTMSPTFRFSAASFHLGKEFISLENPEANKPHQISRFAWTALLLAVSLVSWGPQWFPTILLCPNKRWFGVSASPTSGALIKGLSLMTAEILQNKVSNSRAVNFWSPSWTLRIFICFFNIFTKHSTPPKYQGAFGTPVFQMVSGNCFETWSAPANSIPSSSMSRERRPAAVRFVPISL